MNKSWKRTENEKPEQGKKVLCFDKGDVSVRQRFKDYWLPIPYVDSKFADINAPELWQEIDFPNPYKGYLIVECEGKRYNMDELEKAHPDAFDILVIDKCIDCLMGKCSFNFEKTQIFLNEELNNLSYDDMQKELAETLLKITGHYV